MSDPSDQASAAQSKPNLRSGRFKDPLNLPSLDKTFTNTQKFEKELKGSKKQAKQLKQSDFVRNSQDLTPLHALSVDL